VTHGHHSFMQEADLDPDLTRTWTWTRTPQATGATRTQARTWGRGEARPLQSRAGSRPGLGLDPAQEAVLVRTCFRTGTWTRKLDLDPKSDQDREPLNERR
jgi:hypothetical protein